MTRRLYYEDPYLREFQARVVEALTWGDAPAVVLDQTAFYPEGGGQPADRGWLNHIPVVDVQTRPEDRAVVHVLESPLPVGAEVVGRLDWDRRFDHMQQHTAQHILSQAFLRLFDAQTVGFHLGERYTTIDLDRGDLPSDAFGRAEALANQVIEENRPVRPRFVDAETLAQLSLRKPPRVEGPIRLVEVEDFDRVPCGGTHVSRTGEIGMLALVRTERYKGGYRVTFLAGRRARADYARRRELLARLGELLTCGEEEMLPRVERLLQEVKQLQAERRAWREGQVALLAQSLLAQARPLGAWQVVRHVSSDLTGEEMRKLAGLLRQHAGTLVLLGWEEEGKGRILLAAAPDVDLHMGQLIRDVLVPVGGRGGGRPEWAEGGLPRGEDLESVLEQAERRVGGGTIND